MAKAINLRENHAKAMLHGDLRGKFAEGENLATNRDNPMESHPKGAHHTSDDGVREGE